MKSLIRVINFSAYPFLLCFCLQAHAESNFTYLANIDTEISYGINNFTIIAKPSHSLVSTLVTEDTNTPQFVEFQVTDGTANASLRLSGESIKSLSKIFGNEKLINDSTYVFNIEVISAPTPPNYSADASVVMEEVDNSHVMNTDDNQFSAFELTSEQHDLNTYQGTKFLITNFFRSGDVSSCEFRYSRCEDLAGFSLNDRRQNFLSWCLHDTDRPFERLKREQNIIPGWDDDSNTKQLKLKRCAEVKDSCERLAGDYHLGYTNDDFVAWCVKN